jgi:hypothetical protein
MRHAMICAPQPEAAEAGVDVPWRRNYLRARTLIKTHFNLMTSRHRHAPSNLGLTELPWGPMKIGCLIKADHAEISVRPPKTNWERRNDASLER